jgi:hypothetical protein
MMDILGAHKYWVLALAVVALMLGAGMQGYRMGAGNVQAQWNAQKLTEAEQREAEAEALRNFADTVARDYAAKDTQIRKQRDELKTRIKDVTDNRVCFADWAAVGVWNDALQGERAAGDTGGTVQRAGAAAVTDAELLENHVENAARFAECREKVKSIETIYRNYKARGSDG